ncbi:MAG: radical SAM protein [Kiloniellales bacterium]|nr:radical SAM protein [Kiloniellales bacterium]
MNIVSPKTDQSASPEERAAHRSVLYKLPQPEPVPNMQAYLDEREKALASDPRRRANYETYRRSARTGAKLDYMPVKLDIENVSRCNFKCTMCIVSDWHKGKRAEDMSLEDFKRVIDENYGLVEIKLQGVGEPLLQGDDLFEMIRYARARDIWVRTTTNASLLHLRDNHKKLIDSGVNEVQISIDGADKETFQKIRRGSVFERVIDNCKLINAYCDSIGVHRTKMWVVAQQANKHQLRELVDLAGELLFKSLVFTINLGDWAQGDWQEKNEAASIEAEWDPGFAMGLVEQGEKLGVKVRFWVNQEKYDYDSVDKLCPWPFERAFVSSDMRVVPCCYVGNPDVFELGKIGEQSFSDIWFSDTYKEFRATHFTGKTPEICRNCYKQRS